MAPKSDKTPLIAVIGALAAVIGSLTAVLTLTIESPLVTGIGIGMVTILVVLLGIFLGLSIAERRAR